MKVFEAAALVDQSPSNTHDGVTDALVAALGWVDQSQFNRDANERLSTHYLRRWLCTDSWVGTMVYTLDGEPMAVSHQPARRALEVIYFLSNAAAAKVQDFLRAHLYDEEKTAIMVLDPESLIADLEPVVYSSQLLDRTGLVGDRKVTVVSAASRDVICQEFHVRFEDDGSTAKVSAANVLFPLKLRESQGD